jgi:hypothetical protein
MLDLGVSYYGSTEVDEAPTVTASPNTVIGIDGGVMLFDMVELYGGAALDYTDYEDLGTATNLDGLAGGEFGTNIMVGNATFTIGYYFVNEDFSGQYATGSIESFADGNAATDEDGNAIGHAFFNTAWSY